MLRGCFRLGHYKIKLYSSPHTILVKLNKVANNKSNYPSESLILTKEEVGDA